MFRFRSLCILGIVLCVAIAAYAVVPVFLPQMIPALGIPLENGGVFLFISGSITAFLFALSGVIICLIAADISSMSDFILFLYAAAFCILGKCRGYETSGKFCGILIVISNIATSLTAFSGIRIMSFFNHMTEERYGARFFRHGAYIPFILLVLRYILVITGVSSLYNSLFEIAGNIILWFFLTVLICMLNYFVRRIQAQSSIAMRIVFFSICMAFLPFFCQMFTRTTTFDGSVFKQYWTPTALCSLLVIPAGFVCSAHQMAKNASGGFIPKFISGCTTVILIACLCIIRPSMADNLPVLLVICPFVYQLLNIPIDKFLNPRMTSVEHSLDSLERTTFRCSSSDRILEVVADWIISQLNPEFVAFYQKPDKKGKNGRFLYTWFSNRKRDIPIVDAMLEDRLRNANEDEQLFVHRRIGFSVPIYLMHEFAGFIFIGSKTEDDMFSGTEMALLTPVTRIFMESMMVLDLRKQADYVSEMQNQIVFSFADMIESRDGTTGQHIKRTSTIVSLLAKNLREHGLYSDKLMPSDYEMISLAAPLHDIGKIKVPDSILSKPGKLTDEEFETIKTHPVEGEKIIKRTMSHIENDRYLKLAREMALYHHEKWNGKGYPEGLAGEAIPVSARIMAIADVFDALCSTRSYKEAFSVSQAYAILEESSGSHFEPCLVDAMKMLRPELEKIYSGV